MRSGAKQVHVICLESREEMPAYDIEIFEGLEEGITLTTRKGPNRIIGEGGKVIGFETRDVASVFDEEGRFNPKFIPNSEKIMDVDTVILAIGQQADFVFLQGIEGVDLTKRGTIAYDIDTMMTTKDGIFVCGDIAEGAKLFIDAIASGQRAAIGIAEYLTKKKVKARESGKMTPIPLSYEWHYWMPKKWNELKRKNPPVISSDTRQVSLLV